MDPGWKRFTARYRAFMKDSPDRAKMDKQKHIVVIWSKFLPYHVQRIRHLYRRVHAEGYRLTAIEVASRDGLYPFPEVDTLDPADYVCIFSGSTYRALSPLSIHHRIYSTIEDLHPDIVISPSTPFPSGMAAINYCLKHNKVVAMMDDAWELSDRRGIIITAVKRLIHRNVDAAFIPAPTHASYYLNMGFNKQQLVYGVDVVDNDWYSHGSDEVRRNPQELRMRLNLPSRYFLFVGRLIKRKGLETLLQAYHLYRQHAVGEPWSLVLVGEGKELETYRSMAHNTQGIVFAGAQFGTDLLNHYALASAFVLPSIVETWGLVVNEAMASGLPVIVSDGCGAGRALIRNNVNGWLFPRSDAKKLWAILAMVSTKGDTELCDIGARARQSIDQYSLDTFADGVLKIARMPLAKHGGFISNLLTRFWIGRISFYP